MLLETIAKIISDRTGRDASEITLESSFAQLGIDSLDTVELIMNLERDLLNDARENGQFVIY